MDRNTIIGFVLIFVLVIAYSVFNQRKVGQQNKDKRAHWIGVNIGYGSLKADALEKVATIQDIVPTTYADEPVEPDSGTSMTATGTADSTHPFLASTIGDEELITIENEHLKLNFSNRGGKVSSVEVKDHLTHDQTPLVLFTDGHADLGVQFAIEKKKQLSTDSLYFSTTATSATLSGDQEQRISFVLENDSGSIEHRYTVKGNSRFIDFDLIIKSADELLYERENIVRLAWGTRLNLLERDYSKAQKEAELYYRDVQKDRGYKSKTKGVQSIGQAGIPLKWIAHKHQFFASVLVSKDSFPRAVTHIAAPDSADYIKSFQTTAFLPYQGETDAHYQMQFFFGPLNYKELKEDGLGMQRMIPMGQSFLGWINRNVIYPVYRAFNGWFGNVGINILLLAIFIKIILSPLTFRSYVSQAKMRVLKPELDELRAKFGKDQRKMQMEQMKLYRKAGVNMFGGCIPMLLQFPILIALYRFFPNVIDLRQEGFLWADDFSTYDSILDLGFSIPLYGDHVSLFTLMMAVSSFFYSRIQQQMTGGMGGGQMKTLQYIFPFMLLFIFNSFPAGLTYYYFLYNMLTFGQQWLFKKTLINETAIRAKIEQNKARPQKKGGRLERFQKQLEARQRAQMEARRKGKRR